MVGQPGGISALCTLALLNAGVEPDDEKMQKALSYLRKIKPAATYVVALQTMVFARAEPDRDRVLIDRNVKWLESTQIAEGRTKGRGPIPASGGDGDNSNTQFALLALYEAERVGVSANDQHVAAGQDVLGEVPERRRLVGLHPSELPTAPAA